MSARLLSKRGNLGVGGGDPGAGDVDLLLARAGLQPGEGLLGDAHPALRGRQAVLRHVAPRRGIVALLARARVAGEQGLEALQVLLGGGELGLRGRDVGLRGGDLRFGLPDVFGPGAGEDEAKVGLGLLAVGAGAVERQLHVALVEREDLLAGLHAVALAQREGEDAAAGVGREPGFGGLDVARRRGACWRAAARCRRPAARMRR